MIGLSFSTRIKRVLITKTNEYKKEKMVLEGGIIHEISTIIRQSCFKTVRG